MRRETEKLMGSLMEYIEKNHSGNTDPAEIENLVQQYIKEQGICEEDVIALESADNYIELAEEASSNKKKLEYLTKALELEPDNLDVALMMAEAKSKTASEHLQALAALIEKGDKLMTEQGYFRDSMGEFWLVLETRPYMRVCFAYFSLLIECGMMRAAVAEGRRMLELCENDNLGVRFHLIHIYALLEEERAAEDLYSKNADNAPSLMLLPMSVLYYKLGKPDKSAEYLQQLLSRNKDTKKFFHAAKTNKLEKYLEEISPYGYRPYTMDELLTAVQENVFLYESVPYFFIWADAKLKQLPGKKPQLEVVK